MSGAVAEVKTKEKSFREELFEFEPVVDLLHTLSGYGRFIEVTRSSDGHFMGRRKNDISFNDFLGEPSITTLNRTKDLLEKLSAKNKVKARAILRRYRIFM